MIPAEHAEVKAKLRQWVLDHEASDVDEVVNALTLAIEAAMASAWDEGYIAGKQDTESRQSALPVATVNVNPYR